MDDSSIRTDGLDVTITVVIPTIGRPELSRAVLSASVQKGVQTEIVVVVDRPEMIDLVHTMVGHIATVVRNNGHGGAAARNEGAKLGTGEFTAFLDDDDWWEPNKLSIQLSAMRAAGANFCFGSAWFHSDSDLRRLPQSAFDSTVETLASYMVRRPNVKFGYSLVQSSSFVVKSDLTLKCAWDRTLQKHQDWDYALRLNERDDVRLVFVDEPLLHVMHASTGSVSKLYKLESSKRFLQLHRDKMDRRAFADFVSAILIRGAFATGDMREVRNAMNLLRSRGCVPGWPALVLACSGVISGAQTALSKVISQQRGN